MGDVPSLPLNHVPTKLNIIPDVSSNEYMKYYPPQIQPQSITTTLPPTLSTPEVRLGDNNQNPTYSVYQPYSIHPQSYYPYGYPGVVYSTSPNNTPQYFLPYQIAIPPNGIYPPSHLPYSVPFHQHQMQGTTTSTTSSASSPSSINHNYSSQSQNQQQQQSSSQLSASTSSSGSNQQIPMPMPMLVQMPMSLPIPLPSMSPLPPPEENNLIRINSNSSVSSGTKSPNKHITRNSSHIERKNSSSSSTSTTPNNHMNQNNHANYTSSENNSQKNVHKSNSSRSSSKYQKEFEQGLNRDIVSSSLVVGRVFSMSQDQAGCKILQKIVKRGSQEDLEIMYQEVADVLGTILKDVFGNYFFQCLYEQSNLELKRKIVESVLYDIFEGSKNCYGTRSIQCLIKHSCDDTDLFTQLKSQLTPHLYQLCTDRYGNHCIKQLMMSGTYEMNIDIVEFLKSHWYEFCIHQYCNSVIQTCLKTYPTLTLDFCQLIISEVLALIQSEYGNYVIQCLVKNFPEFKETICRLVISYLVPLSRDKYSSMVLQDCVRFASEEIQSEYVREIISSGSLLQLSLHKYSNFVIQEALSVLPLNLKSQLVNILQPHTVALSKSPFGATIVKHLI